MDDIDARLRRAGEAWRDSVQVPTTDVAARAATVAPRNWAQGGTVLLVAAVVIAVAAPVAFRLLGPSVGVGASISTIGVGSQVSATGRVVAAPGSPVLLCGLLQATDLSRGSGSDAHCSAPSVELEGLDLTTVSGAAAVGNATVVNALTVHGTWSGTAVQVDAFESATAGPDVVPAALACPSLVAGQVSLPPSSLASEAEYARLQSEVQSDPDLYAGEWVEETNGLTTVVVGTIGDIGTVSQHLRAVFPYSLCVLAVSHSMSALSDALENITAQAGHGWVGQLAVDRNLVVLRVPIVDAQVSEFTRTFPQVLVVPLVHS